MDKIVINPINKEKPTGTQEISDMTTKSRQRNPDQLKTIRRKKLTKTKKERHIELRNRVNKLRKVNVCHV